MATVPKFVLIPSGYKVDKIYSVLPTNGVGDFDFARIGLGSRVNGSGLIENVQTGIPRLNHSTINGVVSQCPSILLEAQSQNLFTYSEDLTNAVWDKIASFATSNSIIAPDGTLTADKFTEQTNFSAHYYRRADFQITNGVTYTGSVFLKKGERFRTVIKTFDGINNFESIINLSTGIVENGNAKIFYNFNGWIGIEFTVTAAASVTTSFVFRVHLMKYQTGTQYVGDGVSGFYTWGNQFEIGNRTSYISTVASTGTRLAENCNNDFSTLPTVANTNTIVLKFIAKGFKNNFYELLRFSDGTNQIALEGFSNISFNNNYNIFGDGTGSSGMVTNNLQLTTNSINIISFSYSGTSLRFSHNGNTKITNTPTGNFPTITKISHNIGNLSSIEILELKVYNDFKTQEDLNSLTTI